MTPKKAKDVLGTDQYIAQEAYAGNYSPALPPHLLAALRDRSPIESMAYGVGGIADSLVLPLPCRVDGQVGVMGGSSACLLACLRVYVLA